MNPAFANTMKKIQKSQTMKELYALKQIEIDPSPFGSSSGRPEGYFETKGGPDPGAYQEDVPAVGQHIDKMKEFIESAWVSKNKEDFTFWSQVDRFELRLKENPNVKVLSHNDEAERAWRIMIENLKYQE